MFFAAIEALGKEQPARYGEAVRPRIMDKLRCNEGFTIQGGRHGIRETHRLPASFRVSDKKVRGVARIGVLVNEPTIVQRPLGLDRKSTRLNSSHEWISYAVFCLKKKKRKKNNDNLIERHI